MSKLAQGTDDEILVVLDQCLDPGMFKGYFIIALIANIGDIWIWRRYTYPECPSLWLNVELLLV